MIISEVRNNLQALPPEHQRAREIEAILADPRMNGRTVHSIERAPGGYVVETEEGEQFFVQVHYLPSGIGPARFELEFVQ